MIDIKGNKEELVRLIKSRQTIFNMTMSKYSTYMLDTNTKQLAMCTGFDRHTVECLYTSGDMGLE